MKTWILAVLVACGNDPAPPPPPAPPPAQPDGRAQQALIANRCQLCHTNDYLAQQRLSEAAWKKVLEKMRKFGAQLSDDEIAALGSFATRSWGVDAPEPTRKPGPPPPGALPLP